MIDYKLLHLFRLKFKDNLNLQDENVNFLLNCYSRFLNQACNDRHLKHEDRYKKIKKTCGLKFILNRENEKIKEFTFKFIKNKRLIFSLTGIVDGSLFKLEEYYGYCFNSFYGISNFKIDFIESKNISNIKVLSEYKEKSFNDSSLIYKYFNYNEKDYLIFKKNKFFAVKYFYMKDTEKTFDFNQMVYFKEFNNFRFIIRKYHKEYIGENSISKSLIYYLKCTNKDIEDIVEDDINNVIVLNY